MPDEYIITKKYVDECEVCMNTNCICEKHGIDRKRVLEDHLGPMPETIVAWEYKSGRVWKSAGEFEASDWLGSSPNIVRKATYKLVKDDPPAAQE